MSERANGLNTQLLEWQRRAAECAACYVESGMVVGLGSGATAAFAVRRIGQLLRARRLRGTVGVATSRAVEALAREQGIPLTTLAEHPVIDITIDGADEVDPALNLIKGRGAAMLHEKIVARASHQRIIVVDERKLVPRLGSRAPLPVEVVPFGWMVTAAGLAGLGAETVLRLAGDEPVLTDEGNYVLDCRFAGLEDPFALDRAIHAIPGVVEHGLFLGLTSMVVVGGHDGVRLLRAEEVGNRDGGSYGWVVSTKRGA